MKFLTFASLTFFIAAFTSSEASPCPQNQIPNSIHMCIQPQYIQGCQIYKWIDSCSQCQQGYHLNGSKCDFIEGSPVPEQLVGCLEKSNNKCINCANGFIQKEGKCIKGVKDCQRYNENNSCVECKADFSLITGQCRHNFALGCKKQNPDHTCQQCWSPFILNGNHCDINGCMSLNDYGCTTCQCGFYLTTNRDCKQIESGCMRYQRNRCVDCLPHYKLKGGICQIEGCQRYQNHYCVKCKENYNQINGACEFENCYDWQNDQCLVCKQDYRVKQGLCVKETNLQCE